MFMFWTQHLNKRIFYLYIPNFTTFRITHELKVKNPYQTCSKSRLYEALNILLYIFTRNSNALP